MKRNKKQSKNKRSKTKSPHRKKKKKASFEPISDSSSSKHQCLQQMFISDNNYWRQYFQEVLSPANKFPLPPQSPAVAYLSNHRNTKSQIDILSCLHKQPSFSYGHEQQSSGGSSVSSVMSDSTTDSVYSAQMDREMPGPPER